MNTLGKKTGHETAASVGQRLISSGEFVLIETTNDLRTTTLSRFSGLLGGVSLTDCFVMAVADLFQTKDIFGFDAAFVKNGYRLPVTV